MSESAPKKQKLDESGDAGPDDSHTPKQQFNDFKLVKLLSENSKTKMVCVHGHIDQKDAIAIVEKTPFNEDSVTRILSPETEALCSIQNDIYGSFELYPSKEVNGVKTTLIYPATEKHIAKYTSQDMFLISETAENYKEVTLPYIESAQFSIQWVFNILEKKTEAERIVFEDEDPENGFILLPDMKWNRNQIEDLYLVAIIHRKGIKSLRDLTQDHLPLLKNILNKGQTAIQEEFKVPRNQLRVYFHYQPSYYHLHVHFTHLKYDAPGHGVERAHLLTDVIENLELDGDYYKKKTMTFALKEKDGLYKKYQESGLL